MSASEQAKQSPFEGLEMQLINLTNYAQKLVDVTIEKETELLGSAPETKIFPKDDPPPAGYIPRLSAKVMQVFDCLDEVLAHLEKL